MNSGGRPLPDDLLETFSRFVEARAGLHYPRARWPDLGRALNAAARELGCESPERCARLLLSEQTAKETVDLFLSHLTVGETYFFRDKAAFEALETQVLPELIRARRSSSKRLRIWSAGCCTGEEAYSIAIVVSRVLPDIADWHVTILGTDINSRFLKKAEAGIYSEWSFRTTPDEFKERYFRRSGNGYLEIIPSIKNIVSFGCMNLVEDACPTLLHKTNAMDIIFCRNVLMYFSFEQAKNVADKLGRAMVPDGWLFPSGSEAWRGLFGRFSIADFPDTIVYRKHHPDTPGARGQPEEIVRSWDLPDGGLVPAPLSEPRILGDASHREKARHAARADLARQLANEGRLSEALSICDEAISAEKLAPDYHYLRGLILDENGDHEEAAAALQRALYLDHDHFLAHFALGNLMRRQARTRRANRCFENARALLLNCDIEAIVPDSEGLTVGRLLAILDSTRRAH